ncbi:MAG: hypothetical protein JST19_09225 [Bacteroidetes bacterium]|nr:hypothetical protein [Bacteroidota bacterium]
MKPAVIAFIIANGLVHFIGFAKAFRIANIEQLTQDIPRPGGILWLLSGLLFICSAVLFFWEKEWWWLLSASGIIISQYLIIADWHDAKFGTIANAIILLPTLIGFGLWWMIKD